MWVALRIRSRFARTSERPDGMIEFDPDSARTALFHDYEMRRLSFQSQLTEAVEGFSDWDLDAFLWDGWHGNEVGDKRIERPPIAVLGRLRRRCFLAVRLRARTDTTDRQGHTARLPRYVSGLTVPVRLHGA